MKPLIDFSRRENRERFAAALQEVRGEWQKQRRRSAAVAGSSRSIRRTPTKSSAGCGRQASPRPKKPSTRRRAFSPSGAPRRRRTRGDSFRSRRDHAAAALELAAWEVFEVGKHWREADADVAEAIDFSITMPTKCCGCAPPRETQQCRAKRTVIFTSRAAWPRSSRRGIFRWRFSPA